MPPVAQIQAHLPAIPGIRHAAKDKLRRQFAGKVDNFKGAQLPADSDEMV